MRCAGEHIHCLQPAGNIAQLLEVAASRARVALLQDTYTSRSGFISAMVCSRSGLQPFRGGSMMTTLGRCPPLPGLGRLSRVAAEEPRILDAVLPGVLGGVFHCLPDNLHADYLLDLVSQAQSDGTGAAVEIQQDIIRGQLGKLPGNAVELFSAVMVDLIECHGEMSNRTPHRVSVI